MGILCTLFGARTKEWQYGMRREPALYQPPPRSGSICGLCGSGFSLGHGISEHEALQVHPAPSLLCKRVGGSAWFGGTCGSSMQFDSLSRPRAHASQPSGALNSPQPPTAPSSPPGDISPSTPRAPSPNYSGGRQLNSESTPKLHFRISAHDCPPAQN